MAALPIDLLGTWALQRRVLDRRSGQFGHVTGRLELTLAGSVVHWSERGRLLWGGEVFDVTRKLHLTRAADGWTVSFADGRAFHLWRPGEVVEHPCAADLYRGLISVDRAGTRLRTLWDVTGPAKQQRIVTRCVRALSPAARGRRGGEHLA